jgi:hypothetical protein
MQSDLIIDRHPAILLLINDFFGLFNPTLTRHRRPRQIAGSTEAT